MTARRLFGALLLFLALLHSDGLRIFSRGLIHFDDYLFIAPLKEISVVNYFTDYLWRKDVYTYPLRDLLYYVDFALQDNMGFSSFLLINIIWLLVYIFLVFRISLKLLPERWALAVTALVALHPQSVQVVQWTSARKHLMVACFGAMMVNLVLQRVQEKEWRLCDLVLVVTLQIAIALSYSSGVATVVVALGLLWVAGMRREALFSGAIAIGTGALITIFFALQNSDFRPNQLATIGWKNIELALGAFGRMFFNMICPWQPSIYYQEDSILNWVGLGLFLVFVAVFIWAWLRTASTVRTYSAVFFVGAGVVFVPHLFFLLGYQEFFASDRYLFLPFPYVILSCALIYKSFVKKNPLENKNLSRKIFIFITMTLLFFIIVSANSIPLWRSDETLFTQCTEKQNSPKCWAVLIENSYNSGGCAKIFPLFAPARQTFLALKHPERAAQLVAELPLYEGICTVTSADPISMRSQELSELDKIYGLTPALIYSRILLLLQGNHDNEAALLFANAMVGNLQQDLNNKYNTKTAEMLYGQGKYLCSALSSLKETCDHALLSGLVQKIPLHTASNSSFVSGFKLTEYVHVN